MQKQLDEASKQSQEEKKTLSKETVMLRRGTDETGMLSKAMVDWTTSEYEEIRESKSNNVALQGSLNETEKALGNVTLSPDCRESLAKRLPQQTRELQETVNVPQEAAECEGPTSILNRNQVSEVNGAGGNFANTSSRDVSESFSKIHFSAR